MIKEALGLNPQKADNNAYIPSKSSLMMATKDTTNYEPHTVDQPYTGNKKVMIVCTEEGYMTMENGKKFKTGNHPIELFVPILYLNEAGIEVDFYTPTGKAVQIEMWAFPEEDKYVQKVYDKYKSQLNNPKSLQSFATNDIDEFSANYMAIFIPGGHGALLGLPEDKNLGKLLHKAVNNDLHVLSICHGPAAFLAAKDADHADDFLFKDYKIVAFPDSADAMLPTMGYLPGDMTWKFNEELEKLGMKIINALPDKSTHIDRTLITAAGPLAANKFGEQIVSELLKVNRKQ